MNVVERVQVAFETEEVVRLDCKSMDNSDCKKIGVKLRVWHFFSIVAFILIFSSGIQFNPQIK